MIFRYKKFLFGTKAETLARLKPLLSLSEIPDLYYFSAHEWEQNREGILKRISTLFNENQMIIRSSAIFEDDERSTMAGSHVSIPDVYPQDQNSLNNSINIVFSSYKMSGVKNNSNDQVVVQSMIKDVTMSGVVFTQDMNTGAPYYVINYDDQSGRTDTVTSGGQNSNKTLMVHREAVKDLHSSRFKALIMSVQEVEEVTGHNSLDIEYGVGRDNQVYVFQVRKITTHPNWNRGITVKVNDAIERVRSFVAERFRPIQGIYGSRAIFGQMSDWNPVEMIGDAPRPLALSLYRRLITDYAWRAARVQMGYFEPIGSSLMVSLEGKPYIDVRLSFNTFLPKDLDASICNKLVDVWLDRLSDHKELHDKIEFEVAITALDFNFEKATQELLSGLLVKQEKDAFKQSLYQLTNRLISGHVASLYDQLGKIEQLEKKRQALLSENNRPELITVSALLEHCVWYGTIPFSIIARHAFIGRSLLYSLVQRGVLDDSDAQALMGSINTVAGEMIHDIERVGSGRIKEEEFLSRYGHLRPGTYDILSLRYDQTKNLFGGLVKKTKKRGRKKSFSFSPDQLKNIGMLIKETGYNIQAEELISYIRKATEAREYAKFVFTKNISDSLEIIAHWGAQIGLSREELSFLTIQDILDAASVARGRSQEQYLRDKSLIGSEGYQVTLALRLPYVIESPEDVSVVPLLLNRPNYITDKTARGPYVFLSGYNERPSDISGKIVLIERADPGFDWIFSYPLNGLVTKYGGANSHMAIRCAEFGLPAAIGCGEQLFDLVLRSPAVEINCAEGRIAAVEG